MNKKILWFSVLTVAILVLAVPQLVFAMGLITEVPTILEVPTTLEAMFLGFATYFITEGLKKIYPPLAGLGTQLAATLVAGILLAVNGFLAGITNPIGIAAFQALFLFLTTILSAFGLKRIELNLRTAMAARAVKFP